MIKRLLIVGWGRGGKDTAGEYLGRISTLRYGGSTSWAAKELMAKVLGIHPQVAWETRHQHRQIWKDSCDEFRRLDQTFLIRKALETGDIVTGVRDKAELLAAREQKLFDRIVWISRPGVPEDFTVTFSPGHCDEVIWNNGSLLEFQTQLALFAQRNGILRPPCDAPTVDLLRE